MRVLVTGGGGFLGSGIAKSLHEKNNDVSILGRHRYSHLPKKIKSFQGDIRDIDFLVKVFSKLDTVFHTAAFPGIWGRKEDFYSINVNGTRNVIKACMLSGVKKLDPNISEKTDSGTKPARWLTSNARLVLFLFVLFHCENQVYQLLLQNLSLHTLCLKNLYQFFDYFPYLLHNRKAYNLHIFLSFPFYSIFYILLGNE